MKNTKDYTIGGHEIVFRERISGIDTKVVRFNTPEGIKVFKLSYENGNSFEHFKVELFDGTKLNLIFKLTDLGFKRNTSSYILFNESQFKLRVEEITKKTISHIKSLF